jgi:hypothetical protein
MLFALENDPKDLRCWFVSVLDRFRILGAQQDGNSHGLLPHRAWALTGTLDVHRSNILANSDLDYDVATGHRSPSNSRCACLAPCRRAYVAEAYSLRAIFRRSWTSLFPFGELNARRWICELGSGSPRWSICRIDLDTNLRHSSWHYVTRKSKTERTRQRTQRLTAVSRLYVRQENE